MMSTTLASQLIERPVGQRGGDTQWREQQDHGTVDVLKRLDDLPESGDPCPASSHAEGDVSPHPAGRHQVSKTRPAKDGRGIGRSPSESAAHRDLLGQLDCCTATTERECLGDEVLRAQAEGLEPR